MSAFQPGERVKIQQDGSGPGTVVALMFPFDALAVTPVIFDGDLTMVQLMPTSMLVPYLTEDQELEKLAHQLGFPPRPKQPPVISDAMPEWRKADAEWRESLRQFKKNVRDLARNGGTQ